MTVANALAYYKVATIMAEKRFIVHVLGQDFLMGGLGLPSPSQKSDTSKCRTSMPNVFVTNRT